MDNESIHTKIHRKHDSSLISSSSCVILMTD